MNVRTFGLSISIDERLKSTGLGYEASERLLVFCRQAQDNSVSESAVNRENIGGFY